MNLSIKHKDRPSADVFSHVAHIPSAARPYPYPYPYPYPKPPLTTPPNWYKKAEQLNFIARKLYIGLGNRKVEEKKQTKHCTSAKCIVRRIREIIRLPPVSPGGDIKLTVSVIRIILFAQLMSSHHFLSTSTTLFIPCVCVFVRMHFPYSVEIHDRSPGIMWHCH